MNTEDIDIKSDAGDIIVDDMSIAEHFAKSTHTVYTRMKHAFGKEFSEIPPTLLLYFNDGNIAKFDLMNIIEMYGSAGGAIEAIKPLLKADTEVYGILFFSEAFMLTVSEDAPNEVKSVLAEDFEKIKNGLISVSDSQFKREIVVVSAESREGYKRLYVNNVVKDGDSVSLLEQTVDDAASFGGRCVGVFD